MPTKTLRTIKEAKYTGEFTRKEIDRAIRIVERKQNGEFRVRHSGGSASKSHSNRGAKR